MVLRLAFLAGSATLVACQGTISPAAEDLSAEAQTNLVTEMNIKRERHGACNPLTWDKALADEVKTWIVDGNGQCSNRAPERGLNLYNVWVTTFQINPPPVWVPAVAADEWYNSGNGQAFENQVWDSATKMGCAQCRDGVANQGHMVYVYCRITETTGTVADNVKAVNATCDKCAGVTCTAPAACQQPGSCNRATGLCEYPNVADGSMCDDGNATTVNDVCTAGVCKGSSRCAGVTCAPLDPACADMGTCDPTTGKCVANHKPDGTACDDKNPATQNDKCVAGMCRGTDLCAMAPPCTPKDDCHLAGACDPQTGKCTDPRKPEGTACNDGNPKTARDTCDAMGVCVGVDLCAGVTCQVGTCVASSTCDPASGACVEVPKADGTTCDDGNANTINDQCKAGACTGTDTGCGSVTCKPDLQTTCQATAFCIPQSNGQPATCGYTYRPVGASCGNGTIPGQKCTQVGSSVECQLPDLCSNKQCPGDQCTENGKCDPNTGACSYTNKADGTTCNDGIEQTVNDACNAGVCVGQNLCAQVDCSSQAGKCTISQCDTNTGMCVTTNKADGIACDDENDLTTNDQCTMGVCAGEDKCANVQCTMDPPEQCVETQGTCQTSGSCVFLKKADNTPCDDGDAKTLNDVCKNGVCTSGENCEVKLIRQWSRTRCVFGKTYGFTPEGRLYVTRGCRGKFRIVANGHTLRCASRRWRYTECDTYPLLPGCTSTDPEPCPTNTKCPGFTKLGNGNCIDSTGAQFNKASKTVKSKAACIQIARSHNNAVSGVEYSESTKLCTVLVPAGIPLPADNWESSNENNQGVAPVLSTDGAQGVSCWIPDNRCLGVVCHAIDDCHDAGVCEPQTGLCTNPEKPAGSWCDDGDATTWGDRCHYGKCVGSGGQQECWRADSWWGSRKCVKDDSCCGWGAGAYSTERECCFQSFRNGCQGQAVDECWVGDKHFPERTCKKVTGRQECSSASGNWQTQEECCARGAAHRDGCYSKPTDDNDDGVADRPEQCVCDEDYYDSGMDDTVEDYCASTTSPNGNGHECTLPISTGKCEPGFVFCRKAKSVPKSSGEICACAALRSGARNTHTRLCVDKTTNGQNDCYPSNSNGACGHVLWSVCITKTSMTITIKPRKVSPTRLVGHVSALAGYSQRNVVSVVSSCRSGHRYGSRYAMRRGGCSMGSWWAPSRQAAVLGDGEAEEEQDVTLEWDNLPSSAIADAERAFQTNMEIAAMGETVFNAVLKNDEKTRDAMKGFLEYAKPGVRIGPAVTDESEEEIKSRGESDNKSVLIPVLGALAGLCFVGTIALVVFHKKRQAVSEDYTTELVAHEEFNAEGDVQLGNVNEKEANLSQETLTF